MKDHYEVLGIPRNSTRREIRQAFRRLSMEFHPDKNRNAGNGEKFKLIAKAYEVLYDPVKRSEYDGESSMRYIKDPKPFVEEMWKKLF